MKKMKVRCMKTGESFDSLTDAATYAGVDKSVMSKHLAGKIFSAGGMIYMKYDPDWTPEQLEKASKERLNQLYGNAVLIL